MSYEVNLCRFRFISMLLVTVFTTILGILSLDLLVHTANKILS